MSETIEGKGRCLCGAVCVTAKTMSKKIGACHCNICRKWTGGPLLAVDCGTDVIFEGEESISTFNSSEWAERGFCNKCGSHLFYRIKGKNQHIIAVGLFENCESFDFDHQVFIDEKPSYYCFANKTNDMTGAEVFAKYAPSS